MVESSSSGTTFKLDIIKFAKDIMSEIDSIRSYSYSTGDDSRISDNRPTESRVNAFFRLVGLPMIVSVSPTNEKDTSITKSSQKTMTPGFLSGSRADMVIADSEDAKIEHPITNKLMSVQELLNERETKLLDFEKQIGTEDRDKRRAKAFYVPMELKTDEDKKDKYGLRIFKRISPYLVSFRDILPGSNELSKPFLADPESGRPPPDSSQLKRPFIETAIRIRFVSIEGGNQAQTDYLKGIQDRLDQVSPKAANLVPKQSSLLEAFIINQMLSAIDQFADMWTNLQRRRESFLKDNLFVFMPKTSSSKNNPAGKQGNFAIELDIPDHSQMGQKLSAINNSIAVDEAIIGLLPTQDLTSLNGDKVKNVMPNALTNSFVSVLRQPLEWQKKKMNDLNSTIAAQNQAADRLRYELETMTGEFSGISLIDVVFIILSLFLIQKEDLIGLLDQQTIDEMKKDPILQTYVKDINPTEVTTAVGILQTTVNSLYDILHDAIKKRVDKTQRTAKGGVPNVYDPSSDTVDTSETQQIIAGAGQVKNQDSSSTP